ncbi:glycoside hydrolase family 3 N-terminal domain-containing protein [Synechococcus sp. CC9605]|uniref:glycoside hydrolase family 3 N-terminal domain-containing protein n=1 Tax=Synechococcus sp. (strain CC9605) TaxID=110662 RepID=UPI00005D5E3F|nr:glycoside hydrolase family 3 N-terminal domain-containing protein [Synechococcus sp. CC9605]ABB36083.1 putative beta-glucosidase [Synechococcus sp. CC9605]
MNSRPADSPGADSLRRRVAELLVLRASGHLNDQQRRYPQWELPNRELQRLLQEGVGGVILLGGSALELQQRTQQLQGWSEHRLLFCADVEEGVGQRFEGASWLVPPLALGRLHQQEPKLALNLSERYGRCTGEQARRCGLNWVLGPVCDVNNNPANPVINMRAWGEDPKSASALAVAFQRGLKQAGVLGCAKHFPGHGDTASDSHLDLPVLPHSRERLEQIELPPFRAAIAAGVDSVMTAHLVLPELDPQQPATLSKAVLTDLLRQEMGFTGLVVTDALVMEAISARHGAAEAAVLAFEAGADLILMPADADAAIDGLCKSFSSGRLPLERLEQSHQRRAHALASIPTSTTSGPIVTAAEQSLEAELVRHSITIGDAAVRPQAGINLVRVDALVPSAAALSGWSPALRIPEAHGFRSLVLHGEGLSPWSDQPKAPLALDRLGDGAVLLQLFLRGNPFRAGRDAQEPWAAAIQQLIALNRLAGVVVYGSPYMWDTLQLLLPSNCPAAYSAGQMQEAQRQVLNALCPTATPTGNSGAFTD